MKNTILKTLCLVIIAIILLQYNIVIATSTTDLSELDEQIDAAESELGDIKAEKSKTMQQVQNLIVEIAEYQTEIDELNTQISELQAQINQAEKDITAAEEEYTKEEDLLNARLITMYEEGDTSYLDVVLSSESFTDFISKYYLVSELASYDTELLEEIEEKKQSIVKQKEELEASKSELDTKKAEVEQKATTLKNAKAEKDKQAAQLTAEEKETQKELETYEAEKQAITAELRRIAQEEARKAAASGNTIVISAPSASGYIFPVAGLSKANIANKTYPSYRGHTGVDVNINVTGKSVVAVKDGTVQTSKASMSNGRYTSYGEYIIINHHDGTMTLYAHMLAGSRKVSVNQEVKQGQVIGTVGSTGNSSGTHLHFEVRINGSPVNPLPYLP